MYIAYISTEKLRWVYTKMLKVLSLDGKTVRDSIWGGLFYRIQIFYNNKYYLII